MKNLARAAICGVFHFEFADDSVVDADTAVNAVEEIFLYLRDASPAEKKALGDVLGDLKEEVEKGTRQDKKQLAEFYDAFLHDLDEE